MNLLLKNNIAWLNHAGEEGSCTDSLLKSYDWYFMSYVLLKGGLAQILDVFQSIVTKYIFFSLWNDSN